MVSIFDEIKLGLTQAIEYERGQTDAKVTTIQTSESNENDNST